MGHAGGLPAVAMHVMFLSEEPFWAGPLTVAAAAAGAELTPRLVAPLVPLPGVKAGST